MARSDPGAREYAELTKAMEYATPACAGDPRFTADVENLTRADLSDLQATCEGCPLNALCGAYAATSRPPGAFWAGRHYTRKTR